MVDHPDFFNLRKVAFILAAGPLSFLLLVILINFSWHQVRAWQASGIQCTSSSQDNVTQYEDCQTPSLKGRLGEIVPKTVVQ
jgi:hypothetical protein